LKVFISFAILILLGILGIGIRYGMLLRQTVRACNLVYQESLDTIAAQSQTVLADHKTSCLKSYALLSEWDSCLTKGNDVVPDTIVAVVSPVVSNVMLFFREKRKDMSVHKYEHDARCKGYTELLFFPPDAE
jgi:hypothetical protein